MPPTPLALSGLVATAAQEVFGAELHAVTVAGSAVKNDGCDFVPFFSDVDCHLYVAPTAMRSAVTPRVDLAIAMQERLGGLDADDFGAGSWSVAFWDASQLQAWALPPLPGAYRVLVGTLPPGFREGTAEEFRAQSERSVRDARDAADRATRWAADLPDAQLAGHVRHISTWMKSTLSAAAALRLDDPVRGWTAPLATVLDVLDSTAARRYYAALQDWRTIRTDPARLRELIAIAVTILDELADPQCAE